MIGNYSLAWVKKVARGGRPFMAYIGTKAPHDPFDPAPWYKDHWDPTWPAHAPRPVADDLHWFGLSANSALFHSNVEA